MINSKGDNIFFFVFKWSIKLDSLGCSTKLSATVCITKNLSTTMKNYSRQGDDISGSDIMWSAILLLKELF
ncbi:hypothetical protein MKW98_022712 [Papaver atlanticum]|uniref:Uncharacterized protein n=1 Tax=Papaver atlanticum TaxID=357466 RepID=A0AAD4T1Y8_9MAGN|nr:hypothetical protein MKW98_022712 [Papaver atlanticum]